MNNLGCVMINIPPEHAGDFIDFADAIPDDCLVDDGRETDPHVTVLYGMKEWGDRACRIVGEIFDSICPDGVNIKFGKIDKFDNDCYDVLMVEVISDDLEACNAEICKKFGVQNTFGEYHPHLTLAYMSKGDADQYCGDDRFEGLSIIVDRWVMSDANRDHRIFHITSNVDKFFLISDSNDS